MALLCNLVPRAFRLGPNMTKGPGDEVDCYVPQKDAGGGAREAALSSNMVTSILSVLIKLSMVKETS